MNVLIISQCDKRALTETRRILDQFAERRGERAWQTAITESGLETLHKLLRKSARKNTAVACHWIHGKNHSDLLWVVGNALRFNSQGAIPTNTTNRDVRRSADENDWHTLPAIQLLAQMAAMLHDLGKASIAFQDRLNGDLIDRNLYRHEWVSLRLFQAFVGQDDDEGWLSRLSDPSAFDEQAWLAPGRYQRDGIDASCQQPFQGLPPLAAAVGWLVLTHHRIPVVPSKSENNSQMWLGARPDRWNPIWLDKPLSEVTHMWNEVQGLAEPEVVRSYWTMKGPLPVVEERWRAKTARLANGLLDLKKKQGGEWIDNPYVMHLARLSLMLADHHYSSLTRDSQLRVRSDARTQLYANTDEKGLKQPLDEHLLGVAHGAGLIARAMPGFERNLPRLARHRGLRKRSSDSRFHWQNKVADAADGIREASEKNGAFIVNMASTGCGKTLANARILYALSNPHQGMRATYALGLRTLTLQTGLSFRHDLNLREDELAVRVGGSANRKLFEFYEKQAELTGSASIQSLIEEDGHVLFDGNIESDPLLSRALVSDEVCKLLFAPMLVCTVDHMVPATEGLRAGRQIAPMLRLMSSDLILDELDDYDLNDMPALTRLVHWAGMLGTRIVLSSATLPAPLILGMFAAYLQGRRIYHRNRGDSCDISVPCLWTDEFGTQTSTCENGQAYFDAHQRFVERRVSNISAAAPICRGDVVPVPVSESTPQKVREQIAACIRSACLRLHCDHSEVDPISRKRVSFGLVRMANIDPLFDVARHLFSNGAPEGTRIHLCVYHSRFPVLQRSAIEQMLDKVFNRRFGGHQVYDLREVRCGIDEYPEQDHIFIVLASPVCEVGRDWDADWAVVEPSSMRSIIQMAGRVQRHRRKEGVHSNILILNSNVKHFEGVSRKRAAYCRPGFERTDAKFKLKTHLVKELLYPDDYEVITARSRIQVRTSDMRASENLVDLEQQRTWEAFVGMANASVIPPEKDYASLAWKSSWSMTGVLQQWQPFREDSQKKVLLAFLPDEHEESLTLHRVERSPSKLRKNLYIPVEKSQLNRIALPLGERINPWREFELLTLVREQAEYSDQTLQRTAEIMTTLEAPIDEGGRGWRFHPVLGLTRER